MTKRTEKVDALIQEWVGRFVREHVELPKGTIVTVTGAETRPDLKSAIIFVSVLPEQRRGSTLELLRKHAPDMTERLFHDLAMRHVPKVYFHLDTTEAEAEKIEALLDAVKAQDSKTL